MWCEVRINEKIIGNVKMNMKIIKNRRLTEKEKVRTKVKENNNNLNGDEILDYENWKNKFIVRWIWMNVVNEREKWKFIVF